MKPIETMRTLYLAALAALIVVAPALVPATAETDGPRLLVTNSMGRHISIVDPHSGAVEQFEIGPAPWGIALTDDSRAFVSTATGIAVFDLSTRALITTVPYLTNVGEAGFGEYREGGMGIVAAPDGHHVYVGVHVRSGPGWLEAFNTQTLAFDWRARVGVRPFDVDISPDGAHVYSIDHDSFTVTVVDTADRSTRTIDVTPLGHGAFDKPHYATVLDDGRLLLPYQGKRMLALDTRSGQSVTWPLTADTHMHGIATNASETCGVIVGTGPAGSASGPPSLTVFDPDGVETAILRLKRPHEMVAITDDCSTAYLTGGYTFANGGWDGISVVDLESGAVRSISVPDRPLGIALIP